MLLQTTRLVVSVWMHCPVPVTTDDRGDVHVQNREKLEKAIREPLLLRDSLEGGSRNRSIDGKDTKPSREVPARGKVRHMQTSCQPKGFPGFPDRLDRERGDPGTQQEAHTSALYRAATCLRVGGGHATVEELEPQALRSQTPLAVVKARQVCLPEEPQHETGAPRVVPDESLKGQ